MKPILTTIFILILILTFCSRLHAQESDTTKTETILRLKNPYKKNQSKWLNSNDFNTSSYDWSDPVINLHLDRAVKNRSTGNAFGFIGGAALFIGVLTSIQAGVVRSSGNSVESKSTINPFYLIGGTFVMTSIGLKMDANNQLRNAKDARYAR
ncbi:hypothetical protein [Ekhidna sp.]|uniref:hypothetical protein n=1 Tax=Ekhidna sp. TaxID=2608089 RepID=UPI003511F673